jgi:hypothetical protein
MEYFFHFFSFGFPFLIKFTQFSQIFFCIHLSSSVLKFKELKTIGISAVCAEENGTEKG